MIDKEFCGVLEYKLSKWFAQRVHQQAQHFWCDGILLPSSEDSYSTKMVNDCRKIVFSAFIGVSGQEKYKLTLHFGSEALSRYARQLDIQHAIDKALRANKVTIDIHKQTIKIDLS